MARGSGIWDKASSPAPCPASAREHHLQLITLTEVDSTNSEARRQLEAGRPPGFALSAERQTAGRGRLQRAWQTLPGNLSLTIVVPWQAGRADGPTVALATGLAIRRTLARLVGSGGVVSIKWPNDVLIDGRKVSGTLIEADSSALCVGIGINVARGPDVPGYPTTHLGLFSDVAKEDLAQDVIGEWVRTFDFWKLQGMKGLISEYNRHVYRMGEAVRISTDRDKQSWISGICRGVDESGRLVLEGPDGTRMAHRAGDVDVPEAQPADV
jgi:BirA family biotin operon repressor/biotin-[acetyl-CoA-carboxylase] ligase